MKYDFSSLKREIENTGAWFERECRSIRTGHATPSILDAVHVESYGSKVPISQIATITLEGARTLRVSPWDGSQVKAVEKAIVDSRLGLSVALDERGVRVIFPELTTERRHELMKIAKEHLEQARVRLRGERDSVWNDIQKQERDGTISEDEKFRYKEEMERHITDGTLKLEKITKRKEEEIMR